MKLTANKLAKEIRKTREEVKMNYVDTLRYNHKAGYRLVRCFVDITGDLRTADTNEYLRKATADETQESNEPRADATGIFMAIVSERTLRRNAPQLERLARMHG